MYLIYSEGEFYFYVTWTGKIWEAKQLNHDFNFMTHYTKLDITVLLSIN